MTEEQFISTTLGNLDDLPAMKLTNKEMELLKGGWWIIELAKMILTPTNCRTCDCNPYPSSPLTRL